MAYGMDDRVREQVSSFGGGTGALTLPASAVSGFQTFLAGWGASGTGEYCIVIGSQWEVGLGTLNAGGTTLTRTDAGVYDGSSGAGARVNFSAGTADVFGVIPAEYAHYLNTAEITVASATTCNIGAVRGSNIVISGTTTITGLGTSKNRRRFVRFSGALTLTYNATTLVTPGAKDIVTVAGDTAVFASDASGNWRCLSYTRSSNLPVIQVIQQRFTATGTYTPTPGMIYCIIEAVGGGGGGGGAVANVGQTGMASGGGGGGYSLAVKTAAQVGASQAVTIGAAGTGGAAGANNGTAGGNTSVGALVVANGGGGGNQQNGLATSGGGAGGAAGTGDIAIAGQVGTGGFGATITTVAPNHGHGGHSRFGSGGAGALNTTGVAGSGFGSGGGPGGTYASSTDRAGGNGAAGYVVITEFCTK